MAVFELIHIFRWSPENIDKIDVNTFLPFGLGPRGCLGVRFGMEQMKMAICTLVHQFEFFPTKETLVSCSFSNCLKLMNNSIEFDC